MFQLRVGTMQVIVKLKFYSLSPLIEQAFEKTKLKKGQITKL